MKYFRATVAAALAVAVLTVLVSMTSATRNGQGFTVTGLWFGTVFFGDPHAPATPRVQFAINFDRDGTLTLDSTAETGQHPLVPGHNSVLNGVWTQHGRIVRTKGFFFGDGAAPPGTFHLGRTVAELRFVDADTLVGISSNDQVPCPNGPFLGCPDPTVGPFLQLGSISQGTAFYNRFTRFQ